MFDTLIHLTTALVPCLGVLAFLLLHRRQDAKTKLERLRLQQEHCQLLQQHETWRAQALTEAAQACAPALVPIVEKLLAQLDDPVPPSAAEMMDRDLLDELRRRIDENDFEGLRPDQTPGEGPLDEFLEHLWARGLFGSRTEVPVS
jgi:hypothetical protein